MKQFLNVCEVFESIQGEGLRVGEPSVFLRLSGCNLRCSFCDTKYAWAEGQRLQIEELAKKITSSGIPNLVITGGEPLLQEKALLSLIKLIRPKIRTITIETNGTIFTETTKQIGTLIDFFSISPKTMFKKLHPLLTNNVCQFLQSFPNKVYLKLLVFEKKDLVDAVELLESWKLFDANIPVFLQPGSLEGESSDKYVARARNLWTSLIEILKEIPESQGLNLRFLPQIHKLLFGNRRGI